MKSENVDLNGDEEFQVDQISPKKASSITVKTGKVFKKSSGHVEKPRESLNSTVNVLGFDVPYKRWGSVILFHSSSVNELIQKSMPFNPDLSGPNGMRKLFNGKKMKQLCEAWKRPYVSWNVLKFVLDTGIVGYAIRDMLNRYTPFETEEEPQIHDDTSRRPLEKDCLKIASYNVPFRIYRGDRVYLDILGAFTLMGKLKIAMSSHWKEVDRILQKHNVSQRDAFRRKDTSCSKLRSRSKKWYSHRSFITLEAVRHLVSELVTDGEKRAVLLKLFDHLQREINELIERKRKIYEEFKMTVDMILRTEMYTNSGIKGMGLEDERVGTEICDSACGRKYHFTIRCCKENHSLKIADKIVGYIVKDDQIFLDKCNAFSALGRMYVIRCSDYRKSDKILESSGIEAKKHYLFEKRNYSTSNPRNRRTHISLDAFITLVRMGFADNVKNNQLLESIEQIVSDVYLLKEKCENYFKGTTEEEDDDDEEEEVEEEEIEEKDDYDDHQESGIESGTSSEGGGSGKTSPTLKKEESKSLSKPRYPTKVILGIDTLVRFEKGNFYVEISSMIDNFLIEADRSIPKLRRRARTLPLQYPFFPAYFKKGVDKYISIPCFMSLIENNRVQLLSTIHRDILIRELYSLQEDMMGDLTEIMDDVQDDDEVVDDDEDYDDDDDDDDDDESHSEHEEGILENVNLPFEIVDSGNKSCVSILDLIVPFQIVNDIVYLDKKMIFKLLKISQTGPFYRVYRVIDRVLEDSNLCLDDAFLYEGRKRSYISTKAFRVLMENEFLAEPSQLETLLSRLKELEDQRESLKTNRILNLKSFEAIPFKSCKNTVYVHTLQLMKVAGFSPSYVENNPSKAYFVVNKLLSQRGVNVNSCFLKQGKSKYVYISLYAVILLFQTEFGPFKDKNKLKDEILEALKDQGLVQETRKNETSQVVVDTNNPSYITIGKEFPSIKYRIKNDVVYIHRKTIFEALGLERAVMASTRGYEPINAILMGCQMDLKTCYIKGRQDNYSYISLEAILIILDSQDPLMVCLEKREQFYSSLLTSIQSAVGRTLRSNVIELKCGRIPFKFQNHRIYLLRHTCYGLSGLYDKASTGKRGDYDIYEYPAVPLNDRGLDASERFLSDGGDEYAYVSIDALLILMNLDSDSVSSSTTSQWDDIISAISIEVPKLKIRVKMEEFRSQLIQFLLDAFLSHLKNPLKSKVEVVDLVTETETEEEDECLPPSMKKIKKDVNEEKADLVVTKPEEPVNQPNNVIPTSSEYESIMSQIRSNTQQGMIGDWEIKQADEEMIRLVINPGCGASSRKMSFIHPDVVTVLRYEFLIQPDLRFAFYINEQKVPNDSVRELFEEACKTGILNLLYHFLTLRPCFGSFNPELVETVGKGLVDCSDDDVSKIENLCSNVIVDTNFIGSSQNGRTYAGTVRSKNCRVLAESRVSDYCSECSDLTKLVINRSVLTDEAVKDEDGPLLKTLSTGHHTAHQRSVWKIQSTNASGCIFVCPQIQSFNSSPPHQFVGSPRQSTTIVTHRVDIRSELSVVVRLNDHEIRKTFSDFEKDKQVGALLDQVASLRFCLGYPDPDLVEKARYLGMKKHLLPQEIAKFFEYVAVDETFRAKTSSDSELIGTIRTPTCRYVAGDYADICNQCRLLQEPLEFLGI